MKISINRYLLLLATLFSVINGAIYSQEKPNNAVSDSGFYNGVILMHVHGGNAYNAYGSLVNHDRNVDTSIRYQSLNDTSPLRFVNLPLSPLFFMEPEYGNASSIFLDFEYGITDKVGFEISWAGTHMESTRQEQLPRVEGVASLTDIPQFYTEFTPVTRDFYSESVMKVGLTYHPFYKFRLDPYLAIRGGGGASRVAYRSNNPVQNILRPESEGGTYLLEAAAGLNLMLTREFGVKLELSNTQRNMKGEGYSSHTLNTTSFTAGIILNWDEIYRNSY